MITGQQQRRYPIGIQTFQKIREGNFLYIDKTEHVYRMTHANSTYVFLSRPRRFGKSLLTSTLRSYFEGRKDLFKGLAIERLEKEWTEYPVLHFDMSTAKHQNKEELEQEIEGKLSEYEKTFGREPSDIKINQRMNGLIRHACEQTGKKVVVLIDEYDAPLLDVVHEETNLPVLRNVMRNFYSPLKACDPYIRFVFMTGITKFSQLSIFSELNNIRNISMLSEYAAICGITMKEMMGQMAVDIELLAGKTGKTEEETLQELIEYYDGYRFTWPSPDIFNPYSLMNAFNDGMISSYWFGSGTPTYLVEMLRKFNVDPDEIGGREAKASAFDSPTETMRSITPLLYQSGYLTIKDYDSRLSLYTLDLPNKEVRLGLMESLLPNYMSGESVERATTLTAKLYDAMDKGDVDKAMRLLQAFLLTIPYTDNTNYEGHYQQVLYILFTLIGFYVQVEVHTSTGRVDMVMRTKDTLYLIELKLNRSAEAAIRQINLKDYAARFVLSGLPIVKVAINFDSAKRTISDWKIEKEQEVPSHTINE